MALSAALALATPLLAAAQLTTVDRGCLPACADTWAECGRQGVFRECCNAEDVCYTKNEYFSQCRAPDRTATSFDTTEANTCTSVFGLSRDNPLKGPIPLSALGAETPPAGAGVQELVKPYWLDLSDPIEAGCTNCADDPKFFQQVGQPMFVYQELCFMPDTRGRRATISTESGPEGPQDTHIFVFNEAGTVGIFDDNSNTICGDGSAPSPANCPDGVCATADDRCPPGVTLFSLSRVELDLPPTTVISCFSIALGTALGSDKVAEIGVDVDLAFVT